MDMRMWMRALLYGAMFAAGMVALQWLDFQSMARLHTRELYLGLIALGFMGLGVWVGARLFVRRTDAAAFDANPAAQAALGLSARELEVLQQLAAGLSNKEIAAKLHVSPNTVKTHVARVLEKLGAKRRTEAIMKARELGILS